MTKRDLFRMAIRLFGLLALVSSLFQTLPTLVQYNLHLVSTPIIAVTVIIILLLLMVYRLLFLYTDRIIDWLKLDQGFDDDVIVLGESSFHTLVKLGIVLFGVYLLVVNVPTMLSDLYYLFKSKIDRTPSSYGQYEFKAFDWYYFVSNLIIGVAFVIYHDVIASKISGNGKD